MKRPRSPRSRGCFMPARSRSGATSRNPGSGRVAGRGGPQGCGGEDRPVRIHAPGMGSSPSNLPLMCRGTVRCQSVFPHLVHSAYLSRSDVSTSRQSCRPRSQRQFLAMRHSVCFEDVVRTVGLGCPISASVEGPARRPGSCAASRAGSGSAADHAWTWPSSRATATSSVCRSAVPPARRGAR